MLKPLFAGPITLAPEMGHKILLSSFILGIVILMITVAVITWLIFFYRFFVRGLQVGSLLTFNFCITVLIIAGIIYLSVN